MQKNREERLRHFKDYESSKTPEDIRIEEAENENDERHLATLDPNEPDLPIEKLWKAWGLEDSGSGPGHPRNRESA